MTLINRITVLNSTKSKTYTIQTTGRRITELLGCWECNFVQFHILLMTMKWKTQERAKVALLIFRAYKIQANAPV